jgi:hypothetical protein
MKKFICLTAALFCLTVNSLAADDVTIVCQGDTIESRGTIVDGRTLVPVRGVFEKLGYTDIAYDADTKTATLKDSKGNVLTITAGAESFDYNGTAVTTDVPQQIIDGRFMIPLRAVGEAVKAKVDWDQETKTATIRKGLIVKQTLEL